MGMGACICVLLRLCERAGTDAAVRMPPDVTPDAEAEVPEEPLPNTAVMKFMTAG